MKKFTAILLTVIMVASLFTSCSNSIAPNIDETVSVSFDEATSRSLTASLENFVKGDYFWKYAAQKNASDGTGLNSGATEAYDEAHAKWVKGDTLSESNKGLGSVAGFSQGIWDFKLFAYKKVGTAEKLAYEGEVTGVSLKKGSANTVTVTVSPVAGATGTLILADTISLAPAKAGNTPTNLAKVYTVTELGGTAAISPTTGTNQWTLDAGAYKVNVDFVKDGFTYASGSVVATVYSNITTTVSGSLAELVTKAEFDSSINPDVMNKEASSDSVNLGTLTQTGASDVTLRESTSKVEATVPAAAASQIITTVAGNDASNNTTIDLALRVDTVSATNTTLELEIGMQATVTQKDVTDKVINQTTQKVTELKDSEGTPVISVVTIKLQPGLKNVVVQHNGTDMVDLSVSTNDQGYSYDANTGILTIKTSSFSPFTVTYDVPDYVAKIGDKKYTSLESAFSAVQSGETIILLKNSAGNGIKVPSGSNFIVDFNNYTYDIDGTTVGSSGTETNGFQLLRDSNIEFRNGKITSTKAKIMIQNYCNLTLRDITLDGSNLVGNYTLSNNFGNITVTGNTQIIAKEGKCAFDVYYWPNNGYGNGVTVTFDENFTGKVSGRIEYGSDGTDTGKAYIAEKANLVIKAGTFEGSIFTYDLSDSGATGINIEGGSFTDLASAIKYASDGATIKLAADVTGKGIGSADGSKTRESLTIDFNGNTYTMNDPAVGSTGTESQAMHWGKSLGAVTLQNGTFEVAEGTTGVKMALQNYINFTAENMTFNFSKIPVTNYGTTGKFDPNNGEFKEYSGLEVPMFNNNSGEMVLKKSTIIMPNDSTKGIYTDGNGVEIIDCIINGAVVIESANKIVKVKNSDITKGVSPYFNSGYTVKESVEGGYTVYTNQTVVNISTTEELNRAITNATDKKANISIDSGKTITLDSGIANEGDNSRTITFIGDGSQTVDVITNTVNAEGGQLSYQRGSSFTFENLTIQAGEGNFDGIVCDELTFKNCTIKGKLTLYGKATFTNCVFDNTMANQYSIWTWGGTDVTFEGCTFNTNGKAILLYGQATEANPTNLVVNNCTFNDRNNGTVGKAAIEIGNDYNATYTLTVKNANVNGFAVGKNTNSKVWANKNSMDAEHLSVTINGTRVH